jgi:hypothetical protein
MYRDTQHSGTRFRVLYAGCRYAECRYCECRGTTEILFSFSTLLWLTEVAVPIKVLGLPLSTFLSN